MNRLDVEVIIWQKELGIDYKQIALNMGMTEDEIASIFTDENA